VSLLLISGVFEKCNELPIDYLSCNITVANDSGFFELYYRYLSSIAIDFVLISLGLSSSRGVINRRLIAAKLLLLFAEINESI
jgi:hypothetical protein